MSGEVLELRRVTKAWNGSVALHEVSLVLRPDRYTCITTLLRILGGTRDPMPGTCCWGRRT
jgi:ABC-type Fe3+/spermidine/putrescine transport system ATPase subunit